ncbi:hypothetical protein GCM10010862_19400 [Devosia nitrariae]|uniref:Uncharacterized protein n=1 Tax=Devosia nitrariae TaxID=2071872 RepID=A0ABQ5W452_9HYPH|nr:hypothetical protein GCM10010862_19400 [Devosia nitrariae]
MAVADRPAHYPLPTSPIKGEVQVRWAWQHDATGTAPHLPPCGGGWEGGVFGKGQDNVLPAHLPATR